MPQPFVQLLAIFGPSICTSTIPKVLSMIVSSLHFLHALGIVLCQSAGLPLPSLPSRLNGSVFSLLSYIGWSFQLGFFSYIQAYIFLPRPVVQSSCFLLPLPVHIASTLLKIAPTPYSVIELITPVHFRLYILRLSSSNCIFLFSP